jgi:putative transposase
LWIPFVSVICAKTTFAESHDGRSLAYEGDPFIHHELGHDPRSLFLAVVLDVFSRRVVGWAMATHLRTELVLDALEMAIHQRKPQSVIHHSDQGCQYTSIAFGRRCQETGVRPSMGSVGDCYDNAMCESFNATLECELLDRHRFKNPREAQLAIFDFIEGWYNPHRRHTAIGNISPVEYERRSQAA